MLLLFLLLLLLVGAAATALMASRFPRYLPQTAVVLGGLALLLWAIGRTQLPIYQTIAPWSAVPGLGDWAWQADSANWPVTGWLLLLLFGALLVVGWRSHPLPGPLPTASYLFGLTAVTLITIWGNSLVSMMAGWLLLLPVWGVTIWLVRGAQHNETRLLVKMGLLFSTLLLLLLAQALTGGSQPFGQQIWTEQAQLALTLAVLGQMGIWPFVGWRLRSANFPPALLALLYLAPASAGGVLLVRLVGSGSLGAQGLLLTLLALFGLLVALRRAWARLHMPLFVATAVLLALAHLVLLAGVWGYETAVLAALRLLILGSGVLFFTANEGWNRQVWWRFVAPAVVLAALAGLPLTAGFVAWSGIGQAFWADGRWILLLVFLLLLMPLVTAVFLINQPGPPDADPAPLTAANLLPDVGALLPALGLLTVTGVKWRELSLLAGLFMLLVPLGAALLFYFMGSLRQTTAVVRQALTPQLPWERARESGQRFWQGLSEAFGEAAAILEGDGNLVWILVLIAVLLWLG
jgi:hypothetical protein